MSNTVSVLPRLTHDIATIKATLKRRLKYKHHVYSLNIRPELVRKGAKFLSQISLYKDHNTVFNDKWKSNIEFDEISEVSTSTEKHEVTETEASEFCSPGIDLQQQSECHKTHVIVDSQNKLKKPKHIHGFDSDIQTNMK